MFNVQVTNSPVINVNTAKNQVSYSVDGSLMNPLEAFYATLAGCAAVYAKKACKELGVSADGIRIESKPFAGAGGPLTLAKFRTEVTFPERFTAEQREQILEAVRHCAVKEIVMGGASIDFLVGEKAVATA